MSFRISLDEQSLKSFETFITLGSDTLKKITDTIKNIQPPPLKQREIINAIEESIPDLGVNVNFFVDEVVSLCNLKRSLALDGQELFDGLCLSIKNADVREPWSEDYIQQFYVLEQEFIRLFSLSELLYVTKALSLKFDYQNLHQSIKILTDIRPVYNEDGTEIIGAIASYLLRLYYQSVEGRKSLSIALDDEDVRNLLESCKRALTKADTAKRILKDRAQIETIIHGEEED